MSADDENDVVGTHNVFGAFGLGRFSVLDPFPPYIDCFGEECTLVAKGVPKVYHPSTNLQGRFMSTLRWMHQVKERYPAKFIEETAPGYILNIEATPSKLVNGQPTHGWFLSVALQTWMCSSLQYAVFPKEVDHPGVPTGKKIQFTKLMEPQYRSVAEQVFQANVFPKLHNKKVINTRGWGEYVVVDCKKLSVGPSEFLTF
jgi:hypothetical protein